jgi:acetyltransferase-like isoleucine patch superfamily enzyme
LRDEQLVNDRKICTYHCQQYNAMACNRDAKDDDLRRAFLKIIEHGPLVRWPTEPVYHKPGKVGANISVEAPFYCEYGYNLCIGRDVRIDRGCIIKDFSTVSIGDNVQIGVNVVISAQVTSANPANHGKARGIKVVIGDNCLVGDGVRITTDDPSKRELRIGAGSYIAAGTQVTRVS